MSSSCTAQGCSRDRAAWNLAVAAKKSLFGVFTAFEEESVLSARAFCCGLTGPSIIQFHLPWVQVRGHPYITSAYFCTFSDQTTHYVSINTLLNGSKNGHFLTPPTQSFSWRNIGMVPSRKAHSLKDTYFSWPIELPLHFCEHIWVHTMNHFLVCLAIYFEANNV